MPAGELIHLASIVGSILAAAAALFFKFGRVEQKVDAQAHALAEHRDESRVRSDKLEGKFDKLAEHVGGHDTRLTKIEAVQQHREDTKRLRAITRDGGG